MKTRTATKVALGSIIWTFLVIVGIVITCLLTSDPKIIMLSAMLIFLGASTFMSLLYSIWLKDYLKEYWSKKDIK